MSTDESQTAAQTSPTGPQPAAGASAGASGDARAPLRTGHVATQLPAWNLEPPRTLLARTRSE